MKDEGDRWWWKKDGGRCTKEGFIAFATSVIHFIRTEGTKACALKTQQIVECVTEEEEMVDSKGH